MTNPFPHVLLLGHRGSPAEAEENTLRSFELALRHGVDGVELDVRPASDGTPVVIHDPTLERTFGRREAVAQHAWSALQSLTGARLPSLQQAAAWAAASGAWLNVELKEAGAEEQVIRILRSHRLMERSFVSSFEEGIVARVGELAPESLRFFLTESWNDATHERFTASGAAGVCLRVDAATPLTLDVLRHEGVPVVVWTVDDAERMRHLLDAGVAGIISNDPAMAVAVRRAAAARA